MLVINPSKPFYINKKEKVIRMGNFKETGKEIEYDDDILLKLFEYIKEPIDRTMLVNKLSKETKYSNEDILNVINYLVDENFISNSEDIQKILSDEYYNRQKLYFYMLNDKVINMTNEILNKKILILGVGGIGSITLELLARSGFKNFTIVDNDIVEKSNLIRQLSYDLSDIGKLKVNAIRDRLLKINEDIKVEIINKKINNEQDIENEIRVSDFVLCTIDKPARIIRRVINDICIKEEKPVLFSGFSEHVAMIGPFVVPNKTACLSCIEKESNDEPLYNVKITPSFGAVCNFISSIVSNEIINYFLKFSENNLIGKTMMFNMYTYETNIIKWKKNKTCKKCGERIDSK
ncbi:MAG: ThiF family adenylyltransferase [Bacilli bacterium]|nr:ThiF family adenylyltransferase [Bacilli bacterium]